MSDWQNPLPLRILVVSDFGVAWDGGPYPVTLDGFNDALAELKPKAKLAVFDRLGTGAKLNLELDLSAPSAFHPDTLVRAIPSLDAAADLRAAIAAAGDDAAKAAEAAAGAKEGPLGKILAPLSKDDANAETVTAVLATLDQVLSQQLDEILHDPVFQRVEASWRGLRMMLEGGEGAESVRFEILPTTLAGLVPAFKERVFDPEYAGSEVPVSAVLLDFDFDHRAHLMGTLEQLAELCRVLQVMLLTSSGPEIFGLKSIVHLTALKDLGSRLSAPAYQRLQKFQQTENARWTALTVNRILLRKVYEGDLAGVERFEYTETVEAARPEKYLWGRAIWLAGKNLAQSFRLHGHCAEISGSDGNALQQGLPVRRMPVTSTETAWSSVESELNDMQANELTLMGLTTLVGRANANYAYFPLITNLYRRPPVVLTLNSAVSHQLFAGHLSHYTLKLLEGVPAGGSDEEVRNHFVTGFTTFLGPLAGENSVEVDVAKREEAGRTARIHVRPVLKIREKDVDIVFELPLGE